MEGIRKIEKTAVPTRLLALLALGTVSCTGQIPESFRFGQKEEIFNAQIEINTKVDLLWVVDNSASMDNSQEKLRQGFGAFALKYMQPTWDIRVAVISTDTYLANPAFASYLNMKAVPNGYSSAYINSRLSTWQNPTWNPNLLNKSTGKFDNGVRFRELVPVWGSNYAKLLPGIHDGPTTALCFEPLLYFLDGATQCRIRDDQIAYNGTAGCLNPNTGLGESSITQCVNTVQNDTVRSGKAVIETLPEEGVTPNGAYVQKLIDDFMVNVTKGTSGHGSERGLSSVLQLISDNESGPEAFFRPGSIRGIIFVSDEEDQSLRIPASPPAGFHPTSRYACDMAGIAAMNPGKNTDQPGGYCCASGCTYGAMGTTCPSKTIVAEDGTHFTYTPAICPLSSELIPVAEIKDSLDQFFLALDGAESEQPNYFVASIVPLDRQAIETLQAERDVMDASLNQLRLTTVDRGDRYIELADRVGNGSLAMNIADPDYSPILDAIGRAITEKAGSFELSRTPTGEEDMVLFILHEDGSKTLVAPSAYVIEGKTLRITDLDVILGFQSTDRILINYQPKSLQD